MADSLTSGHPYDIITFDFCKAFDKAPHSCVINAAASLGIHGKVLSWISSFLANRSQQVKVRNSTSDAYDVISGVIQGSILGPDFYIMLTNSLLKALSLHRVAFADNLKFAADVISHTQQEIQAEINKVSNWANQHHMPLFVEKSVVVHCGKNQPNFKYTLNNRPIPVVNSITKLGVVRSTSSTYTEHC